MGLIYPQMSVRSLMDTMFLLNGGESLRWRARIKGEEADAASAAHLKVTLAVND